MSKECLRVVIVIGKMLLKSPRCLTSFGVLAFPTYKFFTIFLKFKCSNIQMLTTSSHLGVKEGFFELN